MDRVLELESQIAALQRELQDERNRCRHTRVTYEFKSNTGNYDPHSDCYWNEVQCIDCGSRMHFDSDDDNDNYRLAGVIGSEGKVEKHDYETYLKVKKELE
ncbi:hypothetical protein [Vibrio phage TCU_VP02_YC]|uniref:Uncharacterized protein n=1 Tax=Vibrio phage phi-pp2 TaxID=1204514 RepID=I6X2G7_9CAUD|nr:hypothetical protein pp2_189 [Vibrio phage phi-pp2]UNA01709.1 hypothetical protein [Vibrio phage PC-Liy1]URQ03005.1 hypothetical protein PVA8_19 [Vibrio phage PVA8]WBM58741.1 hypothetical protein vBValMPVA8_19 [Vibrio phage vB_ValM_PVA8]